MVRKKNAVHSLCHFLRKMSKRTQAPAVAEEEEVQSQEVVEDEAEGDVEAPEPMALKVKLPSRPLVGASGRGKGGKGLGKGGAKRHRKVLRDNIQVAIPQTSDYDIGVILTFMFSPLCVCMCVCVCV